MSKLVIYTDGGSRGNPGLGGIGVHVEDERGKAIFQHSSSLLEATNNEAEYKAFITSLKWLRKHLSANTVDEIIWQLDSKLVVEQLNHCWKIKEPRLMALAQQAWEVLDEIKCEYQIRHVPREKNFQADLLANLAMDAAQK